MRRVRRRVIASLVCAGALAGGWLWLRDSSLVEVRKVTVSGAIGKDGHAIAAALRTAASDMTTLHVRAGDLRSAVRAYPIVRDVRVAVDSPHRLRIRVLYRQPVAVAVIGDSRVPVAADGTLLSRAEGSGLPTVSAEGAAGARRLTDPGARAAVGLVGAAPRLLLPLVDAVQRDGDGLHLTFRSGPRVDFGDPVALRAKWAAATRLLADPRVAGASYVDVRAPNRPVAGTFAEASAPTAAAVAPPTP